MPILMEHHRGVEGLVEGLTAEAVADAQKKDLEIQNDHGVRYLGQADGWVLRLPPVVPLAALWVLGAALLGSIALALYWTGWVLVQLAGSI
jgi:hypothetical protein